MNSKERVITALNLEEPDRVPMFELAINGPVMEQVLGRPCFSGIGWGAEADPELERERAIEKQLNDHIETYRRLKLDMLSLFPAAPKNWKDKKRYLDKTRGVYLTTDEFGTTYQYLPEADQSFVADVPIKTIDDLKTYEFPDPLADGRTDYAEKAKKIVGDEMAISSWVPGIVEFIWTRITGLERFVIFMYKYPQEMEKFLDKITNFVIELSKSLIDAGVDVIWYGNDTAGKNGPIISPTLHRKFIVPRLKKITDEIKRKGAYVINHTDGNIYPIIEDIISTSVDGIHSIEPRAGMSLKVVKEKYGDKVCLSGNVDVSYTLPFGTKDEVIAEVKECIRVAAPGGGYILASSNTLIKGFPIENIYTMYETNLKYGVYPLRRF
jgi:uroporphyrinogen decarboxylase